MISQSESKIGIDFRFDPTKYAFLVEDMLIMTSKLQDLVFSLERLQTNGTLNSMLAALPLIIIIILILRGQNLF